ncbi:DUF3857 domain-containing protein [Mucilaginibacter robiniae]|uniref:DUF3857 domain-containing protein n=1 Tax=Mucilaginibacter robiniae TaxID=2728022 RepID=A0A7L5DUP1_9SPHI|nr:transglutaminase domain-containing protein [Mucilaginibacter robiniae]QJD94820.1 DUF3857 domain-containing protein [Mucilaginibacter robiniae]
MKQFLLVFFLILFSVVTQADDFPYGTYKMEDMEMKSYPKSTNAHAVVLQEYGKTWVSSNEQVRLIHEYHVKIKIFDSKAFDQGNVEIVLNKSDNDTYEELQSVEGKTYYYNNHGVVQSADLDSKQVFAQNRDKYHNLVKFAMPNVGKGCVIDYKYTIRSPYLFNFKSWMFQSDIPKVTSEYEVHIPAVYNYNVSLRGPFKLTRNKPELERDCFSIASTKCDCSKIVYAMDDIPAFEEEDYMTAAKNFISGMYFELTDYINLNNGGKQKITKEWSDIDYTLKHDEDFGGQMRKENLFKDKLPVITAGKTDELAKAKAIYAYIQKNIKVNNFYGYSTDNGIRKAIETHTGNVADVNLALVAALNAAGINTEAVLLSTRNHGIINKLYPVINDFNYVIAKTNIGGTSYLLDATDPLLPFGLLPVDCINDQGRVLSLNKPSYWIDLKATQKKSSFMILDLTLQNNGKLTGTLIDYSKGYEAYNGRRAIKKFNSVDEYVENLDEKMPKIKILKSEVENVDSLDATLVEKYNIEIDAYDNLNHERLAFNPFIIHKLVENPFKLTERTYPVDMGAPSDSRVTLTIHLPDNYTMETIPENVGIRLPNQGGQFITSFENQNNEFTFSHLIQLNNSIYSPEEYPYLKELFNKIIQTERAEIIFKKK